MVMCQLPVLNRSVSTGQRFTVGMVRNMIRFSGEGLLAPRPTSKLEDHPLSTARYCLFNIFADINQPTN